ncbi:MAG TPA: dihydroorotase [Bacillota bacterium]
MKYCIKGGEIIDPAGGYLGRGDLLFCDGKVVAVGTNLAESSDAEVIPATGKLVLPGLVDLHCHLREPGREDEETVASGARAAVQGGFTAVVAMANTDPAADNAVVISYVHGQATAAGFAKVYPAGAITKGLKGEELAEMGAMAEAGAAAFSDDGKTVMNAAVLRTAAEYSKLFDKPLLLHEEDRNLVGDGVMHEGYWATALGLPGIPSLAETAQIARDLLIAEYTGARFHFCHLSAKESVALIRRAKECGLAVTAEVTPHHLCLTDAMLEGFDPVYRVSPPLRSEADREALWEGLSDGTIDAIATDHAPHSLEEKHREFSLAPTGMTGLETALAAVWTELVITGRISREKLVERMAVRPAQILKKTGGRLRPGDPADLMIFDPDCTWTVKPEDLTSRSRNNPFVGRELRGRVERVWVDGVLKYVHQSFTE